MKVLATQRNNIEDVINSSPRTCTTSPFANRKNENMHLNTLATALFTATAAVATPDHADVHKCITSCTDSYRVLWTKYQIRTQNCKVYASVICESLDKASDKACTHTKFSFGTIDVNPPFFLSLSLTLLLERRGLMIWAVSCGVEV